MNTSDNQKWTLNEVLTNFTKRQAQIAQQKQIKDELKQLMLNQQAQELSQFVPGMDQQQPQEQSFDEYYNAYKQGGISIDPSKKGTFKAQATRMGMSVQQAAKHILANKDKYSSAMVKKANFARNFAKEEGGTINNPGFNALPEYVQEKILNNMEYGGDMDQYGKGGYTVRRSNDRKGKTHVVIGPDGTKKYFGDPSMGERSKSKNGKEAFYARHATNLKNNPYFRAYARATWEEGGTINNPGFKALPDYVQHKILSNMAYGGSFDDPCPPDHYWDEDLGQCVPFSAGLPNREQLYSDPSMMDFMNKLNYRRNSEEQESYKRQQIQKYLDENYKGPRIQEGPKQGRIDKDAPEWKEFWNSEEYQNFQKSVGDDYRQKEFYPREGDWDEKSKMLYNELFNPNASEYEKRQHQLRQYYEEHPEIPIRIQDLRNQDKWGESYDLEDQIIKELPNQNYKNPTPGELRQDRYDNWCPCTKMKEVIYAGVSVMEEVCVPCEQKAEYGGLAKFVDSEMEQFKKGGEMIRRADGSYSQRGLWDNIRANRGSGKKPTKEMLAQERKIKKKINGGLIPSYGIGGENDGCPEGHIWIESQQACVPIDSLSNYLAEPEKYTTSSLERFVNNEIDIEKKLQELELAKQQYPELEAQYTAAQQALIKEQKRVEGVRSRVIPVSYELDKADDYLSSIVYGNPKKLNSEQRAMRDAYIRYTSASSPQSLQDATRALPQKMKNALPNQGRYNVAKWDAKNQHWQSGLYPGRELYCTPYGCFAYQKAGATDVPLVGGNIAFASMSKSGQLPFEKINPSERRPGDVGLMVSMAPADYSDRYSPEIMRPHHTMIYAEPGTNPNNTEQGKFYNAQDGNRLLFDKTYVNTQGDYSKPQDRIDYYRYVGKTRELEASLKDLENRKLAEADRLKNMESSIPMSYLPVMKPKFIDQQRVPMELQNTIPPTVAPPSMRERINNTLSKFVPTRFDNGGQTPCPEGTVWNDELQACVPADQNEAQAFLTNWYQNRMNLFNNPQSKSLEESEAYKEWMTKVLPTIQKRTQAYPTPEYQELIEGDPSVMGMFEPGKNPKIILKESLKQNPKEKTITETHEYSSFLTDPIQKFVYPVHNRVIEENFKSYDEVVKGKTGKEAEEVGAFYDYVTDPQQDNVHSYIMNARRIFNVKPDQVVTEDDVNKWLEKANSQGMLDKNSPNYNDELYILFNMSKGKKGLSNLFNYMVRNESASDKSLNMAKYGGKLGNVPNFF